jgi:hypothetical protein
MIYTGQSQEPGDKSVFLVEQGKKKVAGRHLLMMALHSQLLSLRQGFSGFLS